MTSRHATERSFGSQKFGYGSSGFTNTRPRLKKTELALKLLIKGKWPDLEPRYNISPRTNIATIRLDAERGATLEPLKWGLLPYWSKEPMTSYATINARAETVDTKASHLKSAVA